MQDARFLLFYLYTIKVVDAFARIFLLGANLADFVAIASRFTAEKNWVYQRQVIKTHSDASDVSPGYVSIPRGVNTQRVPERDIGDIVFK